MKALTKHRASRLSLAVAIFFFFALVFLPLITPLLLAVFFAFALDPTLSRFSAKTSKRRMPATLLLAGIFLSISLPLAAMTYSLVRKAKQFARMDLQSLPLYKKATELWESLSPYFSDFTEGGDVVNKSAAQVMNITTTIISSVPSFILGLFVFSAALYVLLTQSRAIKHSVKELDLLTPTELDRIIEIIQKSSYTALVASAISGFSQAVIILIGAMISGFHEYLLIFLFTFISSFVPMVGSGVIGVVLTASCFVGGHIGAGVVMGIAALIAGTIDNFIKPLINAGGGGGDLNPIVSLLGIIGAVLIYGLPGLILGPVLTRLAFQMIPILLKADAAETGE